MFPGDVKGSIKSYLKDIGPKQDLRFRRKLSIMSISLLISTSLWLIMKLSTPFTETFAFQVNYEAWPEGYLPTSMPDTAIDVTVTSSGFKLFSFMLKSNPRTLNLAGEGIPASMGDSLHQVRVPVSDLLRDHLGHELVEEWKVRPELEFIEVTLEQSLKKKVPVHPEVIVRPAKKYALVGRITSDPDSVIVTGPRSLTGKVDFIPTEKLVLEDQDKIFTGNLILLPGAYPLSVEPPVVSIYARVEELTEKVLEVPLPGMAEGVEGEFVTLPAIVSVHLSIPVSMFDEINTEDIRLQLRKTSGTSFLSVSVVSLPAAGSLVRVHPSEVEYYISE